MSRNPETERAARLRGSIKLLHMLEKCLDSIEMSKENIRTRLQELSTEDKRLLRFYNNLPEDELIKQVYQFMNRLPNFTPTNENTKERANEKAKKYAEYSKQANLIQLTFAIKKFGLEIPKAGGKTRRSTKRRTTRKLKR